MSTPLPPQDVAETRSPLSDGEWHRMHPLTPLLRGGLVLVIVAGIVLANLRDRLVAWFLPLFAPDIEDPDFPGDPIDYVLDHNLVLLAAIAVLVILIVIIGIFFVGWRFHTFRITGDNVEVRSGVLFRTHRRAPLDRVQGVNLTRPFLARLVGLAKLEVIGAGLDANVKLEYLTTANAETVRGDILRLASGRQLGSGGNEAPAGARVAGAVGAVSAGITGLIEGAEAPVEEPASVVDIPIGRLIGSQVLSGTTIALIVVVVAIITGAVSTTGWLLFAVVPAAIGFGAYWLRTLTRSLRYSIAPTRSGVRITYGLLTTVTEILPPGRIHAVQVSQPLLWRPFGWWSIRVNRLSGRSAAESGQEQFDIVLPVGDRTDVDRVLRLILPDLAETDWPLIVDHGAFGPAPDDPFTTTPRRARLLRPLSWRRNGFALAPDAVILRFGRIWRSVSILPLARMQSIEITQGPLDRRLRVANIRVHTVSGRVSGSLGILDRDDALGLFVDAELAALAAAASDRTHRWAGI